MGVTTSQSYFENDHDKYFEGSEKTLVEWLRQYSPDDETESFLRGFLGRMLFSGEEVKKSPAVLSGAKSTLYAIKNDACNSKRYFIR